MRQIDIRKFIVLLYVILALSSCGFFKKNKPPPPPEPTRVVLEFEAAGDINPTSEGRPSPLYIRIYQLESYSIFRNADFFSLYDNDHQVLGKDLVGKQEVFLQPNEKRTVYFEPGENTRMIGLLGMFIDYQNTQWKAATGVQVNKTSVINVYVNRTGITVR